jgi:hypothetical protein
MGTERDYAVYRNDFSLFQVVFGMKRTSRIAARPRRNDFPPAAGSGRRSDLAVVPEIDHRLGEGLECVVQPADALEAQQ